MTIQSIYENLIKKKISFDDARTVLSEPQMKKKISYYINYNNFSKNALSDEQLVDLQALVNCLQELYNNDSGESVVADDQYDILQEMLVNEGIPRLTGSVEINDNAKEYHTYTTLRGTLDKVYYLTKDELQKNKSRRYLDDWISSMERLYKNKTGKDINLNDYEVLLQPKFDGTSVIAEIKDGRILWLTRGDTKNNLASNVSHIMNIFNDIYKDQGDCGIKFEVMMSEENKDKINEYYRDHPYRNSRQVVTSTLNSNTIDFKADYLTPVPLRIIKSSEIVESEHPDLFKVYGCITCKLSDRDAIRSYATRNRYVSTRYGRLRTDGVVITITDSNIKKILGRDDNINNFEVAYKFTEEVAQTKIESVEFETSPFGYISPVAIFAPVVIKGNTITRAALSNRERFEELDLHKGDIVNISYDIIPYLTKPSQNSKGKKIEFVDKCPSCHSKLDLTEVTVRCKNDDCISRRLGRILNYCEQTRIKSIGYQIIKQLYHNLLLEDGIVSLYQLHKKTHFMESLHGFGRQKTKSIIAEISMKKVLQDSVFFGALGINGLSTKTFRLIFTSIPSENVINMIKCKNFDMVKQKFISIKGLGEAKVNLFIDHFKDKKNRKELEKLLKHVTLKHTPIGDRSTRGRIVFSGIRPTDLMDELEKVGWEIADNVSKDTKYLIVKDSSSSSSKIKKATELGIPIIEISDVKFPDIVGGINNE